MLESESRSRLVTLLAHGRARGLLGPVPVERHVEHSLGFVGVVSEEFGGAFLDLGSGSGVPGLVLALAWPDATGVLLDSRQRAGAFLRAACAELGLGERIRVVVRRAEDVARDTAMRGAFDLVVARGFGSPAVTAECAAAFLRPGGRLVVSEPPDTSKRRFAARWPARELATLGFGTAVARGGDGARFAVLAMEGSAPVDRPRRSGIPAKRPLWVPEDA